MDDSSVQKSFERLGLPSDASMLEIEQSFRELRNLYRKKSLATYSLMDEEESQEKLSSLQEAYDQILQARQSVSSNDKSKSAPEVSVATPAAESRVVVVDADPSQNPGLFLQQMREAQGLSLRDVADWTKVSTTYLQSIEQQKFDSLPAPVYVRGFLKSYCQRVKLAEARLVIDSFMDLFQSR
ncbi:MAG TPA: helix-turn-helix transcriptional regulator [Geopsychrobacteraceae bacterium]|nr:helix-turn-helix transcriptional regulator [Geopsychrobacteraceae bacterium]